VVILSLIEKLIHVCLQLKKNLKQNLLYEIVNFIFSAFDYF